MIAFLNLLDTQTEREKFLDLYNEYKNLLYWIAYKKTNNTEDAEECVQETFFYIAKHFEKIDQIKSKRTKCYLSTIVTGFAIDIYNKSKKAHLISNDNKNNTSESNIIESKYFENFDKIELLTVFDEVLDEESKIYFYLKYIYGYKSSEISELYKVKDSYIRKKLQYAKETLKKHLEEWNW